MSDKNIYQRIASVLDYIPETGFFMWAVDRGNQILAGDEAGHINIRGYRVINVAGKLRPAHRLAVLLTTGGWPNGEVDHINGDKLDNRIENLRVVDRKENNRNAKLRKDNKSGVRGVFFHKTSKKWQVYINKMEYLGQTPDYFEAVCLRKSAENSNGYHPNHGRSI